MAARPHPDHPRHAAGRAAHPARPRVGARAAAGAAPGRPAGARGAGAGEGSAYRQVASDLRQAIAAGRYPPGQRLPTEAELVAPPG